jgi:hypothetical protein
MEGISSMPLLDQSATKKQLKERYAFVVTAANLQRVVMDIGKQLGDDALITAAKTGDFESMIQILEGLQTKAQIMDICSAKGDQSVAGLRSINQTTGYSYQEIVIALKHLKKSDDRKSSEERLLDRSLDDLTSMAGSLQRELNNSDEFLSAD